MRAPRPLLAASAAALLALLSACGGARPRATESESLAWRAHRAWASNQVVLAADLYRRALDEARIQVDVRQQTEMVLNLAWIHAQLGRHTVADSILRGLPPESEGDTAVAARAETVLWSVRAGLGRCAEGELREPSSPDVALDLAMVPCALESGKTEFAAAAAARAKKSGGPAAAGMAAIAEGDVAMARGDAAGALEAYQTAFEAARASGISLHVGTTLLRLARAAEKKGDRARAELCAARALELFENLGAEYPYVQAAELLDRFGKLDDKSRERAEAVKKLRAGADLDAALRAIRN